MPVIATFTKFDALILQAFGALRRQKVSVKESKRQASDYAKIEFEKEHLTGIYQQQYSPKKHVCLQGKYQYYTFDYFMKFSCFHSDMHKSDANCSELLVQTAAALDNEILQQLFVSTQENNLELCIEYAIR